MAILVFRRLLSFFLFPSAVCVWKYKLCLLRKGFQRRPPEICFASGLWFYKYGKEINPRRGEAPKGIGFHIWREYVFCKWASNSVRGWLAGCVLYCHGEKFFRMTILIFKNILICLKLNNYTEIGVLIILKLLCLV